MTVQTAVRMAVGVVVFVVLVPASVRVVHSKPMSAAAQINQASQALRKGNYSKAAAFSAPIAHSVAHIAKQDRAEAWRIYGLAIYFQKRHKEAERAFVEYLKLQPNAHLEPSLVPPEAIIFFESVRSRHAAALHQYRPRSKTKRRWLLNLFPPAGQVQNGHKVKAVIVGLAAVGLLATSIVTYIVLKDWCDEITGVCKNNRGESLRDRAQTVRTLNLWSGAAFGVVYAYAVIDGLVYFRRGRTRKSVSVGVVPSPNGAYVSVSARF